MAYYRGLLGEGYLQERIVVAGESAGGGLTLSLMLALSDAGVSLPAVAALFSPWTDLAATGDSIRTNSDRCAMFEGAGVAASTRLAERARAAGVSVELKIWPVVPHAWQLAPHLIPEARRSLNQSTAFFRAHVAPADSKREAEARA